jgi:hypothetical protein
MPISSHTTPSGMTFTLRTPDQVPERLRRPVTRKLLEFAKSLDSGDGLTEESIDAGTLDPTVLAEADELNDLLAVALIPSWSLEVPVSLEAVMDLPGADYNEIRRAVAPFLTQMLPDFSPSPEDGSPSTP